MTTQTLSPTPVQRFVDNNGAPLSGGKLYSYQAGSTTPASTYTDSTGSTPNTNPIVLNVRGECSLWIPPNIAYKYVLQDSTGNTIWTVDQVVNAQLLTLYGGVDTGVINAYVLNFSGQFTSYTDGIAIYWIPSHTNTGPSTINVNGLGVVNIVNQDGSSLGANQLTANNIAFILCKGGQFILSSVLGSTGLLTVSGLVVTGSTIPTNGIYLPSSNTVGIATNGALRLSVDGSGNIIGKDIPVGKYKSSTELRTNTIVLANDANLAGWSLNASSVYTIDGVLSFTNALAAGAGLKWAFSYGGSLTSSNIIDSGSVNASTYVPANPTTAGSGRAYGTISTIALGDWVRLSGTLITSTAGTLNFQWSQNSANASATQLLINSYINLTQIA